MEQKTNFFEKFWYLFIIIAIVLIGVLTFLWTNNQKALKKAQQTPAPIVEEIEKVSPTPTIISDQATANLETQSDSDEISDIENDIKATNLTDLDKEMADIEVELSTPE